MQIYFHSRLCSYLSRVPILVEGTVCISFTRIKKEIKIKMFSQGPLVELRQNDPIVRVINDNVNGDVTNHVNI